MYRIWWAVALVLALPQSVWARVDGEPHALYATHRVFGRAIVTGNTLMSASIAAPEVNSGLRPRSAGDVRDVPFDGQVVAAYLFWTGSIANQVDRDATLFAPGGERFAVGADRCVTVPSIGGFFYCRADVSDQVIGAPGPNRWNGRWEVGDVSADPGTLNRNGECVDPTTCQAKYAAWSLVLVYEAESARTQRDVFIHDGFRQLDETPRSPGIDQFDIRGFDFPANGQASVTLFGLEGDAFLGVPPQDTDPVFPCQQCFDFFEFGGSKLNDANNPPNNLFNSSSPGGFTLGVDIDTFDVSGLLRPGDRSVRVRVGSGDGIVNAQNPDPSGGGESFFLGFVLLNVDRNAPNFRRDGTLLSVVPDEGAPRERVVITLTVNNEGTLDARNTVASLRLPEGLTYLPGSLRVDGADPIPGDEAVNPLEAGLRLGNVPFQGDSDRTITFRATIAPDAMAGQRIRLRGTITSDSLDDPAPTNVAVLTILGGVDLGAVFKAVSDSDGDDRYVPGEIIQYGIRITNPNGRDVNGVRFEDDLPPYLDLLQVVSVTGVDRSRPEEGRAILTDMTVPAEGEARITIIARIHDSEQLRADGVPAGGLNGLAITNRALVEAGGQSLQSDDPNTAAVDATTFRLSAAVDITGPGTVKLGEDVNGGLLEPGDRLRYTLRVENTGSRASDVFISDPLPPLAANDCQIESDTPNLVCANGRLQGLVNVGAGATARVVFTVAVDADAANGARIQNIANVRAADDAGQQIDVRSNILRVIAAPIVGETTKDLIGLPDRIALPGERIRYQIRVPNTGNRPATGVRITDTVPDFPFAEVIPGDGGVLANGVITWDVPNIAPGGAAVVSFEALLPPMVDNGTVIANQARVAVAELPAPILSDDPTTAANDDATRLTVRSQARLVANKAVDAPTHRPGEQAVYRFTITNTGTEAARNVVLRDVLPAGIFADVVPVGGRLDGDAVVFDAGTTPALGRVSVGDEITVEVRARLLPVLSNGLIVANQASVVGDGLDARPSDDPNTPEPSDATRFVVESTPVIAVTKAVTDLNGGQAQPGDRLRYTFVLSNSGDGPAEAVVLTDPVPATLTDRAPGEGGVIEGGRVVWRLAEPLVPGAPQTVTLDASIAPDVGANTVISNQASLAANGVAPVASDDPNTPAVGDPTQIRVVRRPDFATSTKTADVREVLPGDLIRWTITVTNAGALPDAAVSVIDPIPEFLEVVDAGEGQVVNGEVRWALADVQAGESRALTVVTRVLAGAPGGTALRNQARITSRRGQPTVTDDPDTAEDDDPTIVTVREIVLIEATKTVVDANDAPARPGDTLVYTITMTNRGTVAAQKVNVQDPLPAGLTVLKAAGADVDGATLRWQLARLAAGETREFIFTARVDMGLANGTRLSNQAQVAAANLDSPVNTDDPTTGALGDPTVVQVVSAADFSTATKTVEAIDEGFRPGNRVRYTLTFTNTGDGVAENSRAVDILPPQLTEIESENAIIAGQRVTTQLDDIAPGETRRVVITARIVAPLDNGTIVSNRGLILARGFADPFVTDDPATPANDATAFTVVSEPRPTLRKAIASPQPVRAGDVVEYRLSVGNDGDATATGLLIRDPIPAPLTDVEVAAPARVVDGTVEWLAPDVAPGETATLSVRARVPADTADGTRVVNRATGPNGLASDDPATPEPDGTAFVVQNRADLARLSKTVIGDFEPGGRVTYTITLENRGNQPAQGIVLQDNLPPVLAAIESDPPGQINGQLLTWRLPELAPRSEATFILRGTIAQGEQDGRVVLNQARVTADNAEPRVSDDPTTEAIDDPTAFTVRDRAELTLIKTVRDDNGGAFSPGDSITYTLEVTNTGNRDANFVTLQDRIPPGLENANAVGGGINNGIALWQIQTIPVDATRRFELRARVAAVPDGTVVVNAFSALLRGADEPVTSDAVRFTVRTGTLTFTKQARPLDPVGFAPGANIEYQLRITNPSEVAVTDIFVEDQVPARFLQAFEPSDGGVFDAARQVIEWSPDRTPTLARIEPGQMVLLTIRAQIRPSIQAGDRISNQALAVPRGGEGTLSDDPTTADANDPTVFEVAGAPVYSVRKVIAAPRGVITAGAEVTYEIQVQNRGQVPGNAPVLVDPIPEGVSYVRESTTLDGAPVADRGGRPPLEAGVGLRGRNGQLAPGETAIVRFTVRVPDDAPQGARVDNQAQVEDAIGARAVSDDPDTAELNDPTGFVVGGGANIDRIIKTARVIGRDGDRAAVGDIIEWTVTITNAGDGGSGRVTFFDEIPANSRYIPGSISVDGAPQTDAAGDDLAEKAPRAVVARFADITGRAARTVVFQTEVTAGPQVANQARVLRSGDPDRLSDDDGDGRDPTIVRVGDLPVRNLRIRKTVTDPTDPPALAGESLIYRLNLTNGGTVDLADLTVVDDLQPGLVFVRAFDLPPNVSAEFEPAPAGAFQNGRVRLTGVGVVTGDTVVIPLEVRVDPTLPEDRELCNAAQAEGPGLPPVESEPVCVQAEVRFGDIGGRVFEDADRSGAFTDADRAFEGMIVRFYPGTDPDGRADAEAVTDAEGRYDLSDLRPGEYRVRVFSKNEVLLETVESVEVSAIEQRTQNLVIDPSGRVYDSVDGTLIDGAEVFIYRDEDLSNADPLDEASRRARLLVPPEDLEAESQQGQRTAHGGMYRFAVRRPGRYIVEVVPPGTAYHAPSILVPVTPGFAFTDDPQRRVVEAALPSVEPNADRTHFLAFDLQGPDDEFFHNHIPVDPLSALIDVEKRALKTQITRGQILTYQIDIINRSPRDLVVDDQGVGGVVLQDVLPKGFKYIAGSSVLTRVSGGQEIVLSADDPSGARILRFGRNRIVDGETVVGSMDLNAGESLRLRYQVSLGGNVKAREVYTNRATLLTDGNIPISRTAKADVRVMPDADFDQGFLFGKVWCDADGDGKQTEGERGLAGVRLYLDNGWYAETDSAGKYHFKDIDPGSHAIKIDARTLLPGAEVTTDEVRVVYFSRGLPAKVGFGVTCPGEAIDGARIEVDADGMTAGLAVLRSRYAVVSGNARRLQVRINDTAVRAKAPKVKLLVDGAEASKPDLPVGGDGAAASLSFRVSRPKGAPRDRWALWVGEIGGKAQQVMTGDGRIPRVIEWNQRGADGEPMLQGGKTYQYRVEMAARDGTLVGSPAGVFGVGTQGSTLPPLIGQAQADFSRGKPSRGLQKALRGFKADLTKIEDGQVRVEVHGGTAAHTETQAEAEAIAAFLVKETGLPAERFVAVGVGLDRPRIPTTFSRSAALNRRVELRALTKGAQAEPNRVEADAAFEPIVRVDAETSVPDAKGNFALTAEVPPDGVVEVFVQGSDGRRAVLPIGVKKGVASERAPTRRVVIEGTPPKGLTLGGVALKPAGLKVKARGPQDPIPLKDGAFEAPAAFTLSSGLKRAARWRFSVVDKAGKSVFEKAAEGQPPKTLLWDGKTEGGLKDGLYRFRLTVRSTRQVIGQSAEGTFAVGDAKLPKRKKKSKKRRRRGDAKTVVDGWSLRVDGLPVTVDADRFYAAPVVRGNRAVLIELTRPDGGRSVFFAAPPAVDLAADDKPSAIKPVRPDANATAFPVGGGPVSKKGSGRAYRGLKPKRRKSLSAGERERFTGFGQAELAKVLLPAVGDTGADVAARDIKVTLPAKGATLNGRMVPISGTTAPGNRVLLGGKEVPVDAEGNFSGSATLEPGAGKIVINTIDPLGNRGVVEQAVVVPDASWFLLAMGESQLGTRGAELDGVESATSTNVGDTLYVHGRAAIYFKGYKKGTEVLGGLFEKYEVTAHIDTARRREFETYFRQVIDPEQFYPVYGDSAAEVKDANSRGPVYVMVQADRSRLTVGNFRSAIKGIELMNYDRALYGAAVHVDLKTDVGGGKDADGKVNKAKALRHELRAFAADQDVAERHAYIEYRGTGGSLYYLPHRELVEGSERIYLVERDKITNLERGRVALNRDIDYTVRYDDGRILLMTPAPTTNLNITGPLAQPLAGNVLDGHPVFVAIEYDHRDPGNFGDTAYGVHARETLFDALTIGGGYVEEGRGSIGQPDYKLWGGELRLKYSNRTRLDAEIARSQSVNGENLISDDGGLTFSPFNLRDGARSNGTSFLLRGGLEIDDLIGDGKKKHWQTDAYWQYIAAGYYAGGTIQQQGLESYGAKSMYWINENNGLFVQHDGTRAEEPQTQGVSLFRAFRREVTRAGYRYLDKKLKIDAEFVHTQADTDGESAIFVTDAVTLGGEYKIDSKWTLLAEQEVVVVGDQRLHQSTGDLLATSVGARYRAGKDLSFELIESVRWSGDNATQLGVRTEIDDRHAVYANQRFAQRAQDMVATTVVGGEERFGDDKSGRAFGEYQLETGNHAGRNRAVMGVGKRTQVVKGLTIDAAYQRSQVLGGAGGEFSQDSVSLGVEWLDNDKVKLSGRYELRYDDNDEDQGRRDRFQVLALNSGAFKLTRDLTLLLRFNYSHTFDLAIKATEAELLEGSFGVAFRPVAYDWVAVIAKYTKRYEQRPIDVALEDPEREEIDVFSIVPIFELPYNLQLVGKFALKRTALRVAMLPTITDQQWLSIARLNYHLTKTWDIGGEYRMLRSELAQTTLTGTMFELNYIVKSAVRLGFGYNFTSFSDDEFARLSEDHSGPFIRVIAHY